VSDTIKAVILGIIEGLTEFLPVSSTGHMVIAMPALKIDPETPPWHAFLYFIQIGAILAVIVRFAKPLWKQCTTWPRDGLRGHLLTKLVVASIPAAAIGLPLNDWVEQHLEKPIPVAIALLLGAGIMEWIESRRREKRTTQIEAISLRQSFLIGLAQCVSIIPGTSRAMATIMGGLLVGLPAATATQFSFYLAIPTLLGAGMLKIVKHRKEIGESEITLLAIGFAVAFFAALAVIGPFLKFVSTRRLRPFAIYRALLAAAVLTYCLWN
jgi:undecaprenyl-diphosphatase